MMKTFMLIIVSLIVYDIIKPRVISFYYKYISGRKIYWDFEENTFYYFQPFFPEYGWKCKSGVSRPVFKWFIDRFGRK